MIQNINKSLIDELREVVYNNLAPYIDDDYSLLDIPYHNNIGDSLIYMGELEFLKKFPTKRLLYKSSARYGTVDEIPRNGILLLHGGGNFGDLWHESHNFRKEIIAKRKGQRIVLFPQTVYYTNEELIKEDALFYSTHSNLLLCARDLESYKLLKRFFLKNTVLLVPDLALYLDIKTPIKTELKNLLFLNRLDLEATNNDLECIQYIKKIYPNEVIEIADWPSMRKKSILKRKAIEKREVLVRALIKNPKLKIARRALIDDVYGIESSKKGKMLMTLGISLFEPYKVIVTNRLHGLILALLMDKEVICFDNSYGKVSAFFNTWLYKFDNCFFKRIDQ